MNKPNNVVQVNATLNLDFFKKWFIFLKPFHGLTDRETDIIACFAKERYELSKIISDEGYLDKAVMNEDTKKKVSEECGITLPHFQVIMGKLRKNNIIVDGKLNPRYIPRVIEENGSFKLMLLFDFQ